MKKRAITTSFLALISAATFAQVTLSVDISADTIGIEDAVKVTYTLSGAQEKIEVLPWEGLHQVAGPNVSSSFSYVNGVSSQSYSESYILVPSGSGEFYIPPASVMIDGEALETEPLTLYVVPDPAYVQRRDETQSQRTTKKQRPSSQGREEEYQRLKKKRELAKKKKKF